MSTAEVEVTNIVDRGDVILVVGSGENVVKLKVNSMFLRAASKTFEALLGPNYAEGQALSYDNPPELPLPEDDPSAMTTICYCLHLKQHLVPEEPDANQILEVAKAVDKYALQEALAFFVQAWLTPPTASTQFHDLGNTLRAALIIGNKPTVRKLTRSLILFGGENYTSLLNKDDSESFVNIVNKLEHERFQLRLSLVQTLYEAVTVSHFSSEPCRCRKEYSFMLQQNLSRQKLEPDGIFHDSVAACVVKLDQIPNPHHGSYHCNETYCSYGASDIYHSIERAAGDVRCYEGLDLPPAA